MSVSNECRGGRIENKAALVLFSSFPNKPLILSQKKKKKERKENSGIVKCQEVLNFKNHKFPGLNM